MDLSVIWARIQVHLPAMAFDFHASIAWEGTAVSRNTLMLNRDEDDEGGVDRRKRTEPKPIISNFFFKKKKDMAGTKKDTLLLCRSIHFKCSVYYFFCEHAWQVSCGTRSMSWHPGKSQEEQKREKFAVSPMLLYFVLRHHVTGMAVGAVGRTSSDGGGWDGHFLSPVIRIVALDAPVFLYLAVACPGN